MSSDLWVKVFDGPTPVGGVIIAAKTLVVFVFLVAGLRLLGKRELGQMNVFDLVLLVVLGNAVQNAMMNNDNTLGGGLIASVTLLGLNRLLNIVIKRSKKVETALIGDPLLLVNHGKPIRSHMLKECITDEQLAAACREHGLEDVAQAQMMVLEVDGSISVVPVGGDVRRTRRHFKAVRLP